MLFKKKKERPVIRGVPVFPMKTMKEAGEEYGSIFLFLILPFYGLIIPLAFPELIFPPGTPPSFVMISLALISLSVVAGEVFLYYSFQRWLQTRVGEAVYLRSETKIGKYEVKETLRVPEVVMLAEPQKKVGKEVAKSEEEAKALADEEREKLVLLPAFKTLRLGKYYMYHITIEDGVGSPLKGEGSAPRYARVVMMEYPWEELDFSLDTDIFEYGFFLNGRSAEVKMVHVGYMFSVLAESVVPVFFIYFSEPHKREILSKGFKLFETGDVKELLEYVHEVSKHQAQELMLQLKEVERELNLYKERYESVLSSQLEVAEDMAAELITIWLEGIESTEKLFGKSVKEKVLEHWWYIVWGVVGIVVLLAIFLL